VRWLEAHTGATVVVSGYADPSGSSDANMMLSQLRAESVRDYFVGHGIAAARVEVKAFGDTARKYGDADGRNRRVTVEPAR
jgi:outer membrane protein OmpA-like peptidoglycan-associated protein